MYFFFYKKIGLTTFNSIYDYLKLIRDSFCSSNLPIKRNPTSAVLSDVASFFPLFCVFSQAFQGSQGRRCCICTECSALWDKFPLQTWGYTNEIELT